jgi:flagellar hook-associated protein 1 FlgK
VSLFSSLNTASTALNAQQRAIDVTGQNVANVNTDGYSRQRVNMQSVGANAVPAIWSVSNQVGGGVDADDVIRIRDAFLEAQAQQAHSTTSNLTVQDASYTAVQQAFGEPGTTGIQSMMNNFWAGWSDIASNTTDSGARAQLLERAQTLVSGMHSAMGTLDEQWSESHDAAQTLLTDVNSTAQQIADLNQSIKQATQSNLPSNDLADKRDALVMHLSEQIGATSAQADDGTLTVVVGGISLVSGNNAIQLKLAGANDAASAASTPVSIITSPGGATVQAGGTAAGQLATMNSIIPGYQGQLNGIAQQLADQVNAVHENGYDQNGNPGAAFFTDGSGGTVAVSAKNITVAVTDPAQLAAASLSKAAAGGQPSSDNANADVLYQLRLGLPQPDGSYADGADAIYRKMIVSLGVQASSVSSSLNTNNALSTQVDASRESVSGVNIDEEMTNMLQYQHAYAAAGQLVSTISSMMDTLINMVGR